MQDGTNDIIIGLLDSYAHGCLRMDPLVSTGGVSAASHHGALSQCAAADTLPCRPCVHAGCDMIILQHASRSGQLQLHQLHSRCGTSNSNKQQPDLHTDVNSSLIAIGHHDGPEVLQASRHSFRRALL